MLDFMVKSLKINKKLGIVRKDNKSKIYLHKKLFDIFNAAVDGLVSESRSTLLLSMSSSSIINLIEKTND